MLRDGTAGDAALHALEGFRHRAAVDVSDSELGDDALHAERKNASRNATKSELSTTTAGLHGVLPRALMQLVDRAEVDMLNGML